MQHGWSNSDHGIRGPCASVFDMKKHKRGLRPIRIVTTDQLNVVCGGSSTPGSDGGIWSPTGSGETSTGRGMTDPAGSRKPLGV